MKNHSKGCQCIRCDYGGFMADLCQLKWDNDERDRQLGRVPPPDFWSKMSDEQRRPYRNRWKGGRA